MPFHEKLPPMPPGKNSLPVLWHGIAESPDEPTEHIVFLGIGRPVMQETDDGELVAVIPLGARNALRLAQVLLKELSNVLAHMDGEEDCTKHVA